MTQTLQSMRRIINIDQAKFETYSLQGKPQRDHGKFVLIFVADSRHAIMVRPLSLGSLRGLGNGFGRHGAAV